MGKTPKEIREFILNADDLPRKKLSFSPWGLDNLYIKKLSARERDAWEGICMEIGQCITKGDFKNYSNLSVAATLVIFALCDEKGEKVFPDLEDLAELNEKSGAELDKISEEIQEYNEISSKDVDDIEKNSKSDQAKSSK